MATRPPKPTHNTAPINPASVRADELGAVPVLMHHQLLATPKGDYDQTPAQFRTELEQRYRSGYRTVTVADLVARTINLPAGASPMVLTFDDSTASQYGELPDGTVDPASAVGILLAVAKVHGDGHPVASFYVHAAPFRGKGVYLAKLHALGMEIGEHTATHANLRQLDDTGVQRELVQGLAVITGQVPPAIITTMALLFGVQPRNAALAYCGSWMGHAYSLEAVLLVGAGPARSPYSKGFDALAMPRIRTGRRTGDQAFTSTYWLPKLLENRYGSDGDPSAISFPRAKAAKLAPAFAAQARPY